VPEGQLLSQELPGTAAAAAGAVEQPPEAAFLAGGGELGQLMRQKDWGATSLGDPADWPRSLKTVVRIMLTSRQPIWIGWGEELLYLYNDPYKSIIGGKHPWALGQPTSTVWREIWGDIQPLLQSAMSGDGTFVESQLLIMERNGYPEETYYTFSYSPIPGDDGQPAGIICANSDETRRVIGERQLALLREMAAASSDAKTVALAVERCTAAMATNRRDLIFTAVFLREHGEASPLRQVAADAAGPQIDPFAAPWDGETVLRCGQPQLVELPGGVDWPRGDWKVPPRQAMVLPILPSGDAGQEGLLVVGLNPYRLADAWYRDFLVLVAQQVASAVANAHAYETQLRRAEELARLDRAKTQFFSNVSHEFRTPLTLMQGPLADLLATPGLEPHLQQQLAMVERNALRLSKLVNSLLEFSRIEAGRHGSVFRATDLARFTEDLASNFRSAMERAGLRFVVDCAALPQPVYVDPDQWERVVLNLLSNALKFTLQGAVTVRLYAEAGHAVLQVQDTGVGVPEDEVDRLFERFHRVQGSQGRTHEGSGIGLALVQELVRLHGGTVAATSRLGAGTTFTVRLPFGRSHLHPDTIAQEPVSAPATRQVETYVQEALRWLPDAQSPEALPADAMTPGAALLGDRYRSTWGAHVLVADDNADLRQYLVRLLQPYFDVEAVADGMQALDAVRRRRPALLLSDVMMPRLDGFALLDSLRQDPSLRSLPVILLSARAGEEARVEGLRAGADDYLVKPFASRELLVRVAAAIALDRMRRVSEEQLRLALAGARMFTWDIDLATWRVRLSDNAADVLGVPPRDFAEGLSNVHPEDARRHEQLVQRVIEGESHFRDEIRILRPDTGEVRWLEVRGHALRDDAGAATLLSGVSFDITERKLMEQALRELDLRKDEFLAMLAHELRNPMAPIRNAVEVLQRLEIEDERALRATHIIERQVRQLNRMVDDLLDVSRITRGRIELEHRPVDLGAVIAAAVEAAEPLIRERRHQLGVRTGLPLVVTGDAARLQQCIVNLLANAAKYTDEGGRIDVELQREQDRAIVRVSDNGAGIAPELLPSVFELFVQADRTLDRSQGGLGIGLSVVKRLVEMHGGQVRAHSEGVGRGATFEIRLPLATGAAAQEEGSGVLRPPHKRVLIVDDNRDAAESLAMLLEADGQEVRIAHDGPGALARAADWAPDLVLLDIGLPGMDGYEVAQRLRAGNARTPMVVVALTGYGQPADRQRARAAGFDHHLVKPAPLQELQRIIESLVPAPRLGTPMAASRS
jgi:PAS domain S-box-containing protein